MRLVFLLVLFAVTLLVSCTAWNAGRISPQPTYPPVCLRKLAGCVLIQVGVSRLPS